MKLLFSKPTDDPKMECGSCPNCGTYLEVHKDQHVNECHICRDSFFIIRERYGKTILTIAVIITIIQIIRKCL